MIVRTYWQVEATNKDEKPFIVGSDHQTLDGALWYRDKVLKPRERQYRKTTFQILRIEVVSTPEDV